MGEAKLRGSFEERKAMAAERERKARLERAKRDALRFALAVSLVFPLFLRPPSP